MAGTCISTVKFIGVSSLGLLAGSISFNAFQVIPKLINQINLNIISVKNGGFLDNLLNKIFVSKWTSLGLGSLSTSLLSIAYIASSPRDKHPYLIYAALGAPIALFSAFYQSFEAETKLITRKRRSSAKKQSKQAIEEEIVDVENAIASDEDSLGKSYIHVSDDDGSDSASTPSYTGSPVTSAAAEPQLQQLQQLQQELTIEEEVENALEKKELVKEVEEIQNAYYIGASITGVSFLIATIGLVGDLYYF